MSAWSDWQCGAITYEEYAYACRQETLRNEQYYYETMYGTEESEEDE